MTPATLPAMPDEAAWARGPHPTCTPHLRAPSARLACAERSRARRDCRRFAIGA